MSRINTNVQSLIAQRVLGQNNYQLNNALERLSTGLRINRGKDDPAGLIASENLRSEIKAIGSAIGNGERSDQVVNIAEGGLQEISGLLTELQGLITASANSAGLSTEEKEANQLQIDSILQTIDRIAGATSFQGTKLLNGNFDYSVDSVASGVTSFQVNGAKFNGTSLSVEAVITQSAQQGQLFLSLGGATLSLNGNGASNSAFTLEIAGALGSRELSFSSGVSLSTIASTINTFSDITGVQATASGTGLTLKSSEFGSSEFVSVKVVNDGGVGSASSVGIYNFSSGDANSVDNSSHTDYTETGTAGNGVKDLGQDLAGTVNGIVGTSNGRTLRVNSDFLSAEISFDTSTAQTVGSVGTGGTFSINGGGADFLLAPSVDIAGKVSLGIADVASRKIGQSFIQDENGNDVEYVLSDLANGKSLNMVNGDLDAAQKIVDAAINDVSSLRGRLGAFQRNTIGATVRSLGVSLENTSAAESIIRDADFATETAGLTRSQILVAASTNTLALANQSPQNVLSLLG